MSTKPKKPKTISGLKKEAWKLFSFFIRERDNWTCFTCNIRIRGPQMHAGHFIPRTHANTFFDELNVHAQCLRCNFWGGGQPHIYAQKIINTYGRGEFDRLVKRGRQIKQFKAKELEGLIEKYE